MKRIQLLQKWPSSGVVDTLQEEKDVVRIQKVFLDYGYEITFAQSCCMWELLSSDCGQEWLQMPHPVTSEVFIWKSLQDYWCDSIRVGVEE